MATVSNISAKITADASGAKKGFEDAGAAATRFAQEADSKLKAVGSSFQTYMAGLLTGGVLTNLPILGAIAEFGKAFKDAQREAANFGASVQELDTIKFFGKDKSEELKEGLGRLQRVIAEAAGGSEEARTKFERLGLSWRELGEMSPVEQLQAIGRQLKTYDGQLEKSILAHELFGRSGHNLIGALEKEGWEKAAHQAETYGQTVREAQKASAGFFSSVKDMWDVGLGKILSGQVVTHNYLADEKGIGGLAVWLGLMKEVQTVQVDENKELEKQNATLAANQAAWAKRVAAIEAAQKIHADEEVNKVTKALQNELMTLIVGADEAQRNKLQFAGATPEQIESVKQLQETFNGMRDAKKILEDMKTPAEKLQDELKRIAELFKGGFLGGGNWENASKAAIKAAEKLGFLKEEKAVKIEIALPAAMEYGTQQALSAINAAQRQATPVANTAEQQAAVQAFNQRQQILQVLQQILAGQAPNNVVDF